MSWDVYLTDDRGHVEAEQNYTHNVNGIIREALLAAGLGDTEQCGGPLGRVIGPAWWDRLNGMSGPEGQLFLKTIADEIVKNLPKYEAMNPENGWGNAKQLAEIFHGLVGQVPEWPCTWSTNG